MITVANLSKRFGAREVLTGVSFTARPGEIVRLLGPNGAGKSTLLRCLLGVIDYDGEIRVAGRNPQQDGCAVRALIGYMPQQNGLHLDLTVRQTMAFYADLRGVDHARIAALLAEAGLCGEERTRVGDLSGGMRQRLAFSVAVLADPPVLMLDEPNASLDTASHKWLAGRIHAAASAGRVVLVSTHLGQSLFEEAPRSVLLEGGRVVEDREPRPDSTVVASGQVLPVASLQGSSAAIVLARKELRDSLRNKWLLGYAVLLGALGVAASVAGLDSVSGIGLDNMGRTTATLMNLCLLLSPLLAVVMGAGAVAGEAERGTLDHLLAQPLSRTQILIAKHAGLIAALALATLCGFVPAALVVAGGGGWRAMPQLLLFPVLAILASCSMAAIGLLISVSSRSAVQAQGTAVLVWFTAALFYDLLLIGVLAASQLPAPALAATLLANPIDAARVLGVLSLEPDLYLLGPAGAYVTATFGVGRAAALLLLSLSAWSVLPVVAAIRRFRLAGRRATTSRRLRLSAHKRRTHAL